MRGKKQLSSISFKSCNTLSFLIIQAYRIIQYIYRIIELENNEIHIKEKPRKCCFMVWSIKSRTEGKQKKTEGANWRFRIKTIQACEFQQLVRDLEQLCLLLLLLHTQPKTTVLKENYLILPMDVPDTGNYVCG